jgi:transcription factor IIIB subunit 2
MKTLNWEVNKALDPSIYIARFVALLEFGEDEGKVKNDAVRIATRFKEDWIHEGRRTAGICGAAIYLAAQMNNYRRSIQEIVQVCRIADTTILKRLEEFSATTSANLTVGDFRVTERPTEVADPPAFTRARVMEKGALEGPGASRVARRGKKRSRSQMEDTDESISRASSVRRPGVHSDAPLFLALSPASAVDRERSGTPRAALASTDVLNRGIFEGVNPELPRESSQIPVPSITQGVETVDVAMNEKGDEAQEKVVAEKSAYDGQVIEELVVDPEQVEEVQDILQSQAGQMILATIRSANEAQGADAAQQVPPAEEDSLKDLDEEELDNYICDENEAQLKERVWTEFNLDYLRKLAGEYLVLQARSPTSDTHPSQTLQGSNRRGLKP